MGEFRAQNADGSDLKLTGKPKALLALIASAPDARRSRSWLREKLWSDRNPEQATASLRQALLSVKKSLGTNSHVLLSDRNEIGLERGECQIDINNPQALVADNPKVVFSEFLEGMFLQDAKFQKWLVEQRAFWKLQIEAAARTEVKEHAAQPRKPSAELSFNAMPIVAVYPFAVTEQTDAQAHLVEGVVESIIDQMSHIKWVAALSRETSYAPKTAALDPLEFAAQTNASFLITGQMSFNAEGIEIKVDLLGLPEGRILKSLVLQLDQPPSMRGIDQVAIEVVGNFSECIGQERENIAKSLSSNNSRLSDMVWRGRWHMHQLTLEDFTIAKDFFRAALEVDPLNVDAIINQSICNLWDIWARRGGGDEIREVRKNAQRAIKLDVSDARGYWLVGMSEVWLRNFESGARYIEESLRLCPSSAFANIQLATQRIYSGNPEQAYEPIEFAMRLSPFDRQRFNACGEYAMAAFLAQDYGLAGEMAQKAIMLRPAYWYALMISCLANLRARNEQAAISDARQLFHRCPNFKRSYIEWLPFKDTEIAQKMIDDMDYVARKIDGAEF